jgi:GNAT superfamily N-acetyltransferase
LSGLRILPYDKALHGQAREGFKSGSLALDDYFRNHFSQDLRNRMTAGFVASDADGAVVGFYTLAASGVDISSLSHEITRRLPRYPLIPVVRLGRLAIDQRFQGQGYGGVLLADALFRAVRSGIGAFALVVDAKDEAAVAFYVHHGFQVFPEEPLVLFLPLANLPYGAQ